MTNVYWLETVLPDGSVQDVVAGCDRERSGGYLAVVDSLRPYPSSRARSGLATAAWSSIPAASASPAFRYNVPFPHVIEAGTPDARYAILELAFGSWRVTFRHVPYDHDAMAALARQNGDAELASALATGWIR